VEVATQSVSHLGSALFRLSAQSTPSPISRFCASYSCIPQPLRPNCDPSYPVFDPTDGELLNSPSPFHRDAWMALLRPYSGSLPSLINGIITYGCKIGYSGPQTSRTSRNLPTAQLSPETMSKLILNNLRLGRVSKQSPIELYVCSLVGFVPKPNGKLRKI